MTRERRQFSDDEKARIEQGIERTFAFVQDVLDDPSVLDDLPERAPIKLTPIDEIDDDRQYDAETRNFAISIEEPELSSRQPHSA